jgi:hypothetical protein
VGKSKGRDGALANLLIKSDLPTSVLAEKLCGFFPAPEYTSREVQEQLRPTPMVDNPILPVTPSYCPNGSG